jgi:hypothetical protein
MSQFERTGAIVAQSYHSYITENVTLHNIGLASYTRNSLAKFGKEKRNGTERTSPDINEYFGGSVPTAQLLGDSQTLQILKFDKDNKRYLLKTSSGEGEESIWWSASGDGAMAAESLLDFQTKFDLLQKGFLTGEPAIRMKEAWSNIQTSKSGCITFTATYPVLTCNQTSLIRLYFQSAGRSSTKRGVATQSNAIFAGVPATQTGRSFGMENKLNSETGSYPAPNPGGNKDPGNTVAAPMRMSYDSATGKWESGTQQMMIRMLSDVDGVPLKELPDNVDDIPIGDFYDGPLSSEFKVGYGMPVTTENGNPYLFGPNAAGCGISPKEKVLIVNRTPRNFKKGEHVLGSLINGEWIPIGLGLPTTVSKKLTPEWSQIQKFIADAKSFFRNRYDTKRITPEIYEDYVRFNFYASLDYSVATSLASSGNDLTRLAILNMLKPNLDNEPLEVGANGQLVFASTTKEAVPGYHDYVGGTLNQPSLGYLQFFDADTVKEIYGGNNADTKLGYGNLSQLPPDQSYGGGQSFVNAGTVTSSWGMYFPQGYTSSSVSRLLTGSKTVVNALSEADSEAGKQFPIYKSTTLAFPTANVDPYLYHFPAQFALNASGNQSIFANLLWLAQKTEGIFTNNMLKYMADPVKGDWLKAPGKIDASGIVGKNVYQLSPINPAIVQFTPLSLQLALCSTIIDYDATNDNPINGGYRDLKSNLAYPTQWSYKALGKAWDRLGITANSQFALEANRKVYARIGFGQNLFLYEKANPMTRSFAKPLKEDYPDGGPGILPSKDGGQNKDFSNVVGIIGARSTINLTAGGQLSLKTTNNIGLNTFGQVLGGGGSNEFSFLGSLGSFFTDNRGKTLLTDNVQWGASNEGVFDAFGTTALWCKVYDHCPNTVYDPRYFVPLQFNGSTKALDNTNIEIDVPVYGANNAIAKPGDIITSSTPTMKKIKNPIRRNMLLTGGGFYCIQNILSANPNGYQIVDGGAGYTDTDKIKFGTAVFKPVTDKNGKITSLVMLDPPQYGEFSDLNTFKTPLIGVPETTTGTGANIKLNSGRIIEKIVHDKIEYYGSQQLTPGDNQGNGDDGGYVRSSKTGTFNLSQNATGRYDIFYLFVNDILNYTENSIGATFVENEPTAQFVNLEISAN